MGPPPLNLNDGPGSRTQRDALERLIARLRGEAIACTPTSRRELLLGTYRRRAFTARQEGWNVPILHPRELEAGGASWRAWADFYLPNAAPGPRAAIYAVTAHIARACDDGEIEIDPWDVIAWLGEIEEPIRTDAQGALQAASFLPASDTVEVLSFVHATEQGLSLRLLVSRVGFGDRSRHFLLRYFLDDAQMPAAEHLFAQRGATLWVEGSRVLFSVESDDAARALLAFNELVEASRLAVVESAHAMAIFCEMPARIGMLAGLEPWGDIALRHGVALFEVG